MSEQADPLTATAEVLTERLDRILHRLNEADDLALRAEQGAQRARSTASELERSAQRMRLALFALEGADHGARAGAEANTANGRRRRELRSS